MTTPAQAPPVYKTFKRQVQLAPNQHLADAAGKGYYAAPGAAAPAAAVAASADPYSAILGSIPKPLTGAQITSQAAGEISPLVAAITKTIGGQTANATNAISGFTGDAASKLAAIDFAAPYAQGEQGQAAVDAALRQELAGAGSTGADALASRLGVINDPTVGAAAGALAANGDANATTQVAQGSASLGELLANAASAKDYGLKQPGITRLAGLDAIAAAGQQGQAQIAAQAQALEAQLPSIIQNLQARNDARTQQVTAARENQLARQDAIASGGAATAVKIGIADANNATKVDIANVQAAGRASTASAAQARSDRSYRLQYAKTFGFDPVTNATLPGYQRTADGSVVKIGKATGPGGVKVPTANEINNYINAWKNGKPTSQTVKAANPDANGNPVYRTIKTNTGQLNYQQAYKRLTTMGVPDPQARTYLDTAYKRGEQGRAWLTNEEQHTLTQASLPPRAYRYKGVGYIDQKQASALKAAGAKLPPGQWIQGSTATKDLGPIYVIDEAY